MIMIRPERLITVLKKLVQTPSENPPGNEAEVARIVEGLFISSGIEVKSVSFEPGRPNVIGILKGVSSENPLLLVAHLDTVPAGGGWRTHPFGGKTTMGRIYGRGASDDKCHVAILTELAASLREDRSVLSRDVIFLAMADEETGGKAGIAPLLRRKILPFGEAVILDVSGFEVVVAQKGLLHAKINISGKKAHGAYPSRGRNAIEDAAKIITLLKKEKIQSKKHEFLGPPTINIGTITGGERVNVVADSCSFEVDARFPPSVTGAKMESWLKKIINSVTNKYELVVESEMAPVEIDKKHPLVVALCSAIEGIGRSAAVGGSSGATLMAQLVEYKIPCVSVGFGMPGREHAADEYVLIKDVVDGAYAMERFLKSYLQPVENRAVYCGIRRLESL